MSKVRLRRLTSDYQNLYEYVCGNPRVELVQAVGNPPEKYQLCYQIKSLRKDPDSEPVLAVQHMVEIVLPRDYPRTPPLCRMLTSVFHPNIAPHAICIGDHWNAGEPLWSMVSRIGEMLAYQSFNVKSPLNGEAARWVEKNMDKVPLDTICMIPDAPPGTLPNAPRPPAQVVEAEVVPPARVVPPPPPPMARPGVAPPVAFQVGSPVGPPAAPHVAPPAGMITISCPGCQAQFRIKSENYGRSFRCPKCQTTFK